MTLRSPHSGAHRDVLRPEWAPLIPGLRGRLDSYWCEKLTKCPVPCPVLLRSSVTRELGGVGNPRLIA